MEWELTDEEMRQAWLEAEHKQGFNPTLSQYEDDALEHDRSFAEVQAEKLVKDIELHQENGHILIDGDYWQELRRQVGFL